MQDLSVERIVKMLDLAPHPEGGFYRETFRDPHRTAQGRSALTAIYFLLPAGVKSRWQWWTPPKSGTSTRARCSIC